MQLKEARALLRREYQSGLKMDTRGGEGDSYIRDDGASMIESRRLPGVYVRDWREPEPNKRTPRKPGGCTSEASKAPWRNLRLVENRNKDNLPRAVSGPDIFTLWYGSAGFIDFSLPTVLPTNWWPVVNKVAADVAPLLAVDEEAAMSRERQRLYSLTAPKNDSEIFPRKPRNSSPTHEKDAAILKPLMRYRRLNASLESLQTIYGRAECECIYAEDEDMDDVAVADADAELENRPSVEEMQARLTRMTVEPFHFLPILHNSIEVYGFRKGGDFAERINIADVDRRKPWSYRRIGGLLFETFGSRRLSHYVNAKNPNLWHRAKEDVAGTPRGPAFLGSADQDDEDEMRQLGWEPVPVQMRKTTLIELSHEERAEQWLNKLLLDEHDVESSEQYTPCRDLYHRRKRQLPRALLPYYQPVLDRPNTYAFGATYTLPDEPHDDVIERRSELAEVNARLTSQGLLIANALVLTHQTLSPARTYEALGALLCCSDVSQSTRIRVGKQAIQDTASELSLIFRALDGFDNSWHLGTLPIRGVQ